MNSTYQHELTPRLSTSKIQHNWERKLQNYDAVCSVGALRCTIDALLRDCDARADARGWVLARAEPRRQGRVHHHQLEQHQVTQRVPSGAS